MKKITAALLCCLLTIINILYPIRVSAQSDTADEPERLIGGIVAFKQEECGAADIQGWIDSALAEGAGSASETYILALHQSGVVYDYSAYSRSLLGYLAEKDSANAVTRQKYALSLLAANCKSEYIAETAENSIDQLGVMSRVYGLHLLNNSVECTSFTAQEIISLLLDAQLADGGWAVHGETSDVDVTAMVLQALAPHQSDGAVAGSTGKAVDFLSAQQLDSGAFASYGTESCESTAQVIIALSSLGIDCQEDSRFIKGDNSPFDALLRFRLDNGSFAHTVGGRYDHMATSQAFAALTAMVRLTRGQGPLYVLDPQPDNTVMPFEPEQNDTNSAGSNGWRLWACVFIAVLALGGCVLLYFLGKRNIRNYAVVTAVAVIASALVFTLDIQTPDEYYGTQISKSDTIGTVTITIRCDAVAGAENAPHIPQDGVILDITEMPISQGDTVYDILTEAARAYSIHMESSGPSGMSYVSGIGNIYEFDHGELSGWLYRVNGQTPSVGCASCELADGDRIEWLYSLEMGNDLN